MATFTRASQAYPPGSYAIPLPTTLQHTYTQIDLTFTRENWPAVANLLTVTLEKTLDGGQTWTFVSSAGPFVGGVLLKNGQPILNQTCGFSWANAQDGDLRLRADVGTTLTTAITAVLS